MFNDSDDYQKEFDDFIDDSVEVLEGFPVKQGKEGKAYFVDENFIVKKYDGIVPYSVLDSIFELYAKEQQDFAKKGYKIPQIYAYKRLIDKDTGKYNFYLLEEKINGRELFTKKIEDIYITFSNLFKKSEFDKILANPENFYKEYYLILEQYINDFISQNYFIELLSNDEIDGFVKSIYYMFLEAEYSYPDVYPANILIGDAGIHLIDNQIAVYSSLREKRMKKIEKFFSFRFSSTFLCNREIDKFLNSDAVWNMPNRLDLFELRDVNLNLCKNAMLKITDSIQRCLDNEQDFNFKTFLNSFKTRLSHSFGENFSNDFIEKYYE